jgi:hypothetical protein
MVDNLASSSSLDTNHPPAYVPRTELGGRLWAIRQRAIAAGETLLGWEEVEKEVAERRGIPEEIK